MKLTDRLLCRKCVFREGQFCSLGAIIFFFHFFMLLSLRYLIPSPLISYVFLITTGLLFVYLSMIINVIFLLFLYSLDRQCVTHKGSYQDQERPYLRYKGAYKQCVSCFPLLSCYRILPRQTNLNCQVLDKMSSKDSKGSSDPLSTKAKKKDKTKKGKTPHSFPL